MKRGSTNSVTVKKVTKESVTIKSVTRNSVNKECKPGIVSIKSVNELTLFLDQKCRNSVKSTGIVSIKRPGIVSIKSVNQE